MTPLPTLTKENWKPLLCELHDTPVAVTNRMLLSCPCYAVKCESPCIVKWLTGNSRLTDSNQLPGDAPVTHPHGSHRKRLLYPAVSKLGLHSGGANT
jgi:hypothetical protein